MRGKRGRMQPKDAPKGARNGLRNFSELRAYELLRIRLLETVWKVPTGTEPGLHGPRRGVKRSHFRVVGERSSLVEAPPTDFPDSLWKGYSPKFAGTAFLEVRECGVPRKLASKVSKTTHFGGCSAPREAVTLGATTPVRKGGELDEGDRPRRVRLTRCPGTEGHRPPRVRR